MITKLRVAGKLGGFSPSPRSITAILASKGRIRHTRLWASHFLWKRLRVHDMDYGITDHCNF